jgi:hypothetical protein
MLKHKVYNNNPRTKEYLQQHSCDNVFSFTERKPDMKKRICLVSVLCIYKLKKPFPKYALNMVIKSEVLSAIHELRALTLTHGKFGKWL